MCPYDGFDWLWLQSVKKLLCGMLRDGMGGWGHSTDLSKYLLNSAIECAIALKLLLISRSEIYSRTILDRKSSIDRLPNAKILKLTFTLLKSLHRFQVHIFQTISNIDEIILSAIFVKN